MSDISSKILVVIPHSSEIIPEEIDTDNINDVVSDEIYFEIDEGTEYIYDFRKDLHNQQLLFSWHRAFIDVNQDPDVLDNSIPVKTFFDHDLYLNEPSETMRRVLLNIYHAVFHQALSRKAEDAIMIFDSHSTSVGDVDEFGDRFDSDISVANCQVQSDSDKTYKDTCNIDLMNYYVDYLDKEFKGKYTIGINTKYLLNTFGYIEGRYGQSQGLPYSTPVLLQEINEALYTDEKGHFDIKEMEYLRIAFANALKFSAEKFF